MLVYCRIQVELKRPGESWTREIQENYKLKSIVLYVPALPRVKSDTEKEVVWMDYKQVTTAR